MFTKLFLIKVFHTIIFFFMSACLMYILYCGIAGRFDWTLLVALSAIFAEGVALLLNNWHCPLTSLAEKHGALKGSVSDIFAPRWLSDNLFRYSTILFTAELVLLGIRYFTGR